MADFLCYTFPEFDPSIRGQFSHRLVEFFDEMSGKFISFKEATKRLECICKSVKKEIEDHWKILEEFVIGKSYADLSNVKGISSRWGAYKKRGFDGLVVVAIITKENRPGNIPGCADSEENGFKVDQEWQEFYSNALELELINHFMLVEVDKHIGNRSLNPGRRWKDYHDYGVVYLAYKLGEQDPDSSSQHTIPDPGVDYPHDYDGSEMHAQSSDGCMIQADMEIMEDDFFRSIDHFDFSYSYT